MSTDQVERSAQHPAAKDQSQVEKQVPDKLDTAAEPTDSTLETPLPTGIASSGNSTPQGSRLGRHRSKRAPGSSMPDSEATSNIEGLAKEIAQEPIDDTQDALMRTEHEPLSEADYQAMTKDESGLQDKPCGKSSMSVTLQSATDPKIESALIPSPETERPEFNVTDPNAHSSPNEVSKRLTKVVQSLKDISEGCFTKIKRLIPTLGVLSLRQYRPNLFDLFEMKQWRWRVPPGVQDIAERTARHLAMATLIVAAIYLVQSLWWITELQQLGPASVVDFCLPAPDFKAKIDSIPLYDDEFATSTRFSVAGNVTYAEYRLNTTRSLRQAQDHANRAMNLSFAVSDHCFAISNAQTLFNAFAQTCDNPPCQERMSFWEAASELMKAVVPAKLDKLLYGRSLSSIEHPVSTRRPQQWTSEKDSVDAWMETLTKLFADPIGPLDHLDAKPAAQMALFLNDLSAFSQRHAERVAKAEKELRRIEIREMPIGGLMSFLTYNKGPRLERWAARSKWEVLSRMYRETRVDVLALALQVPPLSQVLGRESQAMLAARFKDGHQLRKHLLSVKTAAKKQQPLTGEACEQWALAFQANRQFLSSSDLKWAFKKQLRLRLFSHLRMTVTHAYHHIMAILYPITSDRSHTNGAAYAIHDLTTDKLARATHHHQSLLDRQSQLDSIVGLARDTRRCELVLPRLQHALLDLWDTIPEPESEAAGPLGPLPALFSPDELLHVYGFTDLSQTGLGTVGFREAALGFDSAGGSAAKAGSLRVAGWPWAADVRDVPLLRSLAAFESSVTGWEAGIGLARARKSG